MQHPDATRVILTRTEDDGASDYQELIVKSESPLDGAGKPVFKVSQLWGQQEGIASVGVGINPAQVVDPWFPAPGGVRFRFFTFLPNTSGHEVSSEEESILLEDVKGNGLSNFVEAFDPERPGMHISDSVDYVHVLSGEIVLELERREILVKQGDIVIMRGGWHNWRNETNAPCTVASVMVGAHRTKP